jgi:hypothetical protein
MALSTQFGVSLASMIRWRIKTNHMESGCHEQATDGPFATLGVLQGHYDAEVVRPRDGSSVQNASFGFSDSV